MADRFVVGDSNLLIYLTDAGSPFYEASRRAMQVLTSQGVTFLYTSQNLAEFWNVCTRPKPGGLGLSIDETTIRLRLVEQRFGSLSEFVPADAPYKELLIRYQVRGVQVHDARLAALMLANGVTEIVTFGRDDFKRYAELTVIHPDEIA